MTDKTFQLPVDDGAKLYGHFWEPPKTPHELRGVVLIVHGMGEHIGRYRAFCEVLCREGYIVIGYDQRGHGQTGASTGTHGYLGSNGFKRLIKDVHEAVLYIKTRYPGLPIILFAHSMGSFVGQSYLLLHGQELAGAIFSGTNGPEGPILIVAAWLAKIYARRRGVHAQSKLLTKLTFGRYNRTFRPNRTDFDWITSDSDALSAYLADPLCGFPLSAASMYDMFQELKTVYRKSAIRQIPRFLPIFLIAGEVDPVGHQGKGVRKLEQLYISCGLQSVSLKLYPGSRHEILHETTRLQVYQDVIEWLSHI